MAVDGKYEITLDAPIGRQKATLEVVTRGSELSGTMTGAMGRLSLIDGKVDGNNLTWRMEGSITAMYSQIAKWECMATIDGDSIAGKARIPEMGAFPLHGARAGTQSARSDAAKAAIPWTDRGLPRYESISVEWINALQAYVKEKTRGKTVDFEVSWSVEYVNPPAHLLRGNGRDTVGYHFRAKDGKFDAFDGSLPEADIHVVYPYDPFAVGLKMNTDQWVAWVRENGEKYKSQVKMTGDSSKAKLISDLMAGTGNDIREEFLSQQTA